MRTATPFKTWLQSQLDRVISRSLASELFVDDRYTTSCNFSPSILNRIQNLLRSFCKNKISEQIPAVVVFVSSLILCSVDLGAQTSAIPKLEYPTSQKLSVEDNYHGTQVADPYRWLEDVESAQTARWVGEQNKLTAAYLSQLPQRAAIHKRLTEVWNFERYGFPIERRGSYFYTHNDGLQNQSPIYVSHGLQGSKKLLLDPNQLSEDGTVSLAEWKLSDDGRWLAYGVADGGSDWRTWRVRDTVSGKDTSDEVRWVKFSDVAWTTDNAGFFYSRYDEPIAKQELTGTNYFQKLYYHRLGSPQSSDRLVYHRDDFKEWGFRSEVSEDGRFLIISVWRGTENNNQLFYVSLTSADWTVRELISGFDAEYVFLGNDGNIIYLMTDHRAPRRRIISVDILQPNESSWKEIVPQSSDTMQACSLFNDQFLATYLKDACHEIRVFGLDGQSRGRIELPGLGTVDGFQGKRTSTESFYSFTNYVTPPTVYRYDFSLQQSTVWRAPKLAFSTTDYTTERIFYHSKDGTRIPMIVSSKKGATKNAAQRTLMYGYGGFDISITPTFSPAHLVWMELGGLYAVPNLRGGGEYGRAWHEAGMLEKKQNVFDDYIWAAEHLIAEKYTRTSRLAISGRSNGGLLVGACMTQRPDLFAVALPAVGVMDMLRYHKFTIGWAWVNEFGSSDNALQFPYIYRYSPLHNLREATCYPATLVMTADRDDRVVPGHSFKFAARLQACQACDKPTLIRIETRAGHGAGTPVSKLIDQAADTLVFVLDNMD